MCRSSFILARHCRTNLKLRIASPALDIKINFVRHCDRFYFCRKLCQTEMMIVSVFSIFYDRKTRVFATRIFVCRTAIRYQSDFNFDAALNTSLPFYTNNAFMPTLHINVAHISISQAYYFIAIYYQSDHSILLLYKKSHFTQHHFHVGFTQQRQHSSVALLTQYCLFRHRSTCGSTQRNYSKS